MIKISYRSLPNVWLAIVLLFVGGSGLVFGYLWIHSGGNIPLLTSSGYQVTFVTNDADNLVYYNDVRMAGVKIGSVVKVANQPHRVSLTIRIDDSVAPLHQGATIRIGSKSLVEESYVDVTDGHGASLPSGATLPASAVTTSVQLDQVLDSLDPATRAALGSAVRALGAGTAGRAQDVNALFTGLGGLGTGGYTAMAALAAQSRQLQSLSGNLTISLDALDTQRGQIATLVDTGQQILQASADGHADLEATMRELPGVLHSATTASDKLNELAGALAPVARELRSASPTLTQALDELPDTSRELRASMSPLNGTLGLAVPTLDRVPKFSNDTKELAPAGDVIMTNLNPMLGYLRPYGHDIAAFFTNFGAAAGAPGNQDGDWARVTLLESEQSLRGLPVSTNIGPFNRSNAYPAPGSSVDPRPFTGVYPRIHRETR